MNQRNEPNYESTNHTDNNKRTNGRMTIGGIPKCKGGHNLNEIKIEEFMTIS